MAPTKASMTSLTVLLLRLPLILGFQLLTTTFLSHSIAHRRMTSTSNSPDHGHSRLFSKSPKLIVFDLDHTLWTPELYKLRKIERANEMPMAGTDVKLFPGVQTLMEKIRTKEGSLFEGDNNNIQFAIASRTKSVEWAHYLLAEFGVRDLFTYVEIFPGNKRTHFENIHRASGIDYADMLFFDDARDGKYGNCEPVSAMGVLSVHCPGGIDTMQVFDNALQRYHEWDRAPNTIVEWDGSVTKGLAAKPDAQQEALPSGRQKGTIKLINDEKRYGFITYRDTNKSTKSAINKKNKKNMNKDIFFHFNDLSDGIQLLRGDSVSFRIEKNSKNDKTFATGIETTKSSELVQSDASIDLRVFSMNLPFAALLANGYKNLESRNGTMFVPYPTGTQMLLHVGQRTYPDGNKHIAVMKSDGVMDDEQINTLKALPKGFSKGSVVAIMELGKTYETTVEERSDPDMQRRIAAYGTDSGRIVTEIAKVAYLKQPVKVSGKGGVFHTKIPLNVLPDDWLLPKNP